MSYTSQGSHTRPAQRLRYELGYTIPVICRILGVKKTCVFNTLQYYSVFGTPYNPLTTSKGDRPCSLSRDDIDYLSTLRRSGPIDIA